MSSKFSKFKSYFHWYGGRKPIIIAIAIVLILGIGVLIIKSIIGAQTINPIPEINTFSAPALVQVVGGGNYNIKVQVNNVENLPNSGSIFPDNTACIISAGSFYYPLKVTNGTTISEKNSKPINVRRKDFRTSGNLTGGMVYNKETLTLNCHNRYGSARKYLTVQATDKTQVSGTTLQGPTEVTKTNEPFDLSWASESTSQECQLMPLDNDKPTISRGPSGTQKVSSGINATTAYTMNCKDKKDQSGASITFSTGIIVYTPSQKSKWTLDFKADKNDVESNTPVILSWTLKDSKNSPVSPYDTRYSCKKSGDWSGGTLFGVGQETINIIGDAGASKTYILSCNDDQFPPNPTAVGPASVTVNIIKRNLIFTVDDKDPKNPNDAASFTNGNNYQPPDPAKPVVLSWEYKGSPFQSCAFASKDARGKTNIGGFDGNIQSLLTKEVKQSNQWVDYTMACGKESQTIRVLPVGYKLTFNIVTGAGYEHITKTGDNTYTLTKNNFAISWHAEPAIDTAICKGAVEQGTIVDNYGQSWNNTAQKGDGRKIMNINSPTGKMSLQCDTAKVTLTLISNSSIVEPAPPVAPVAPVAPAPAPPSGPFTFSTVYNGLVTEFWNYTQCPIVLIQKRTSIKFITLDYSSTSSLTCRLSTDTYLNLWGDPLSSSQTLTLDYLGSHGRYSFGFAPEYYKIMQTIKCGRGPTATIKYINESKYDPKKGRINFGSCKM